MPSAHPGPEEPLHPIADLYSRWALNPLVDIARAVAHDVVVRPQNYRRLPDDVAEILTDFRFKLGSDPDWPDAFQRTLSFKVLSQVNLASPSIRAVALRAGQLPDGHRDARLLDDFRDGVAGLRAQLAPLEGHALTMVSDGTRAIFERSVRLFQEPQIAQAFALPPAPATDWPLGSNFSGDGAYLVAEIVRTLRVTTCLGGVFRRIGSENPRERRLVPLVTVALPQDKFIKLQKAAYFGASTISRLLLGDSDAGDPELVASAFKWTKALQTLVPDAERAWKDLEYRSRLTDLEWGMAPNPSGDTTPFSAPGLALSTLTIQGEICCCSGDLDCDPTSQLTDFCSEFQCPSIAVAPPGC
jgi:hypothetical protein